MSKKEEGNSTPHTGYETKITPSNSSLAVYLMALGAFCALFAVLGVNRYWLSPPHQKMALALSNDLTLLNKTAQNKNLIRVQNVTFSAPGHTPATEWIQYLGTPVAKNKNGDLSLDITLIHLISEGPGTLLRPQRYGVIAQFEFFDLKTKNKVGEFARTYWLGIYF